jgi:hypothetical protein
VIAHQLLSLHRRDADDGLEDFAEEAPLVYVDAFSEGARPAPLCQCPEPFGHDDPVLRCGRSLPPAATAAATGDRESLF